MTTADSYRQLREEMVARQLMARGIDNVRVLDAMRRVPRHEFVAAEMRPIAYRDCPLPIGERQTISQPYMVALMTQMLSLSGHERVLEIGTGSGYQTAILCELAGQVYSLERLPRLAARAASVLERLNYNNVEIHVGDGSQGLADMAPFDAIIVTAAAPTLPLPLRAQMLEFGGRMVLPVGDDRAQYLEFVTRAGKSWQIEQTRPVQFVPLVGRYGYKPSSEKRQDDKPASV